jgi:predicted Zn-dependent protease
LYSLQVAYANGSREKQYIIEPFVNQYLTAILDSVVRGNRIKGKYEVVCTRYLVPNAFNLGDNRLYINIGLLEQLQNESQLAFLLCHELSHQLLLHVQDTYIANETRAKDKSIKKEIRDINKAKYNKLDKTFQFIKNTQYDYARHSRSQEKSADSMALVLMMKTNYDLRDLRSF